MASKLLLSLIVVFVYSSAGDLSTCFFSFEEDTAEANSQNSTSSETKAPQPTKPTTPIRSLSQEIQKRLVIANQISNSSKQESSRQISDSSTDYGIE